ncbi:ABC transporter permease [Streptomonospora litoralis]|uniref:Branched-chain amino acid transport system / permease component n=1 Tax=Streptomonospora litoralis TaxID=2498135 RepID=A0A4P6Q3G3_9ACTN|nr:ABC transporter permease [Streptomonospora litoralis]QBI53227.1 Branched-chain amino acid transport system / permease component [Streptomonospora litoralis]
MSQDLSVSPASAAPAGRQRGARSRWRFVSIAVAAFVALAGVRAITGQPMLTSAGTIQATLAFAVPIGLAGLGGLWAERAGIINIGLEGMMVLGTWFGAYFAWSFESPWAGLLAGVLGGMAGGLIHAVATVTFGVDHIVSGVAINILAVGAMRYLSLLFFQGAPGGGAAQSPQLPEFPRIGLPFVADALAPARESGIFLVADTASLIVGTTTGMSVVTLLAILLAPLTFLVLWHTPFGLRLRSCGENPDAAESLGVPVYTYKFTAVVLSGGFAGMGGVFLAMVASSVYQEGQTGGRGYIGLAAMIFGNWRPGGLAMGAGLFGFTDALQVRGGGGAVHALLLLIAAALLVAAVLMLAAALRRTRGTSAFTATAGLCAVFAGGAAVAALGGAVAVTGGAAWWWAVTALGAAAAAAAALQTVRTWPEAAGSLPASALVAAPAGVVVLLWYLGTDSLPGQLVTYSPHIATLLVLALASQRLRPPANVGRQWRRGHA